MTKPSTVFKRTTNSLLRYVEDTLETGSSLPTEQQMSQISDGSRTAVRRSISHMLQLGIINDLKERRVIRRPMPQDYFDIAELETNADRIRRVLMERIYHGNLAPGANFSEAELARASGAAIISVREFLLQFSRFGLIEKRNSGGWRLCAFDQSFALELADVRQMFELAAIEEFGKRTAEDPIHGYLESLVTRHELLAREMPARFGEFPALDRDFHSFLIGLLENRFAHAMYDTVSLVFHYHYQWDKEEEPVRNHFAIYEHLDILRALKLRDIESALQAMRIHLKSSRETLLEGIRSREKRAKGT